MKKLAYGIVAGLTAAMLMAGSASAATTVTTTTTTTPKAMHRHMALDQYGCRWKSSTNDYRCYRGALAGERFASQQQMLDMNTGEQQHMMPVATRRGERLVPVYVDDDGAPRPLPPHAARGNELPPVDSDMSEITVW